ncbi:PREDICTED: F-box/WD repeat-containing protein 12-like [Elephantulus edwardii]|uniref:F-box/WD repeat-containing protein 12-like n=1 Tax=Elephantulus edwardii TaxID=28737 RepID=UPI0003F0BBAE|nr:PREDICTED: F-box/WD repeat-containing protein 12-like [Elephantulus edwardii]
MVKQIESKEDFTACLNGAGDKLVVVDFSATWCVIRYIAYLSGSGLSIDGQERSIVCGASSRHKLFAWDMQKRNLAFTLDSSRTIKVWDCYSADALTAISMTTYGSSMEAFVTESGSFLMVGDSVGDIYTFTVPDLRRVSRAHAFQYNVERLLCSPDKKLIFASGCDEAIFPKVFVTEHLLKKSEKDHLMPCSIPVALCWTACWAPRKANRIAMSRRNIDERVTLITFDFTTKLVDGKTLIEDRYEILSYLAFNDGETIAFVSGWYLFLYTIDGTMLQRLANHRSNICYLWSDPVHVLTTGTDDFLNLYMWKEEGRSSRLVHCCRLQQQPGDWTPRW